MNLTKFAYTRKEVEELIEFYSRKSYVKGFIRGDIFGMIQGVVLCLFFGLIWWIK